jgi:hypothetical protein
MVPPAGQSPSAGRLKIKRGVSDSPRKRRARELGYGTDVLALGKRSRRADNDAIVEEDPSAVSTAMTATENEMTTTTGAHLGPSALAKLSALRGWRSDDAVFAVPTVKREVAVKSRLDAQQQQQSSQQLPSRRRPGPPPSPLRPTRTMTSASSSRNESACESDQTGLSGAVGTGGHRSASERMVNGMISVLRRASGTVQPFFKTEGGREVNSPISPDVATGASSQGGMSLGLDTASSPRPCQVAIDMTPALGIKPGRSSAPAQQVLHQTLNSRSSSPWSPLLSSDEQQAQHASGHARPEHAPEYTYRHAESTSGYMTEPVKVSFADPGRRGSQPEVRVTSRPIQCPLPKRGGVME